MRNLRLLPVAAAAFTMFVHVSMIGIVEGKCRQGETRKMTLPNCLADSR
jgi:hypothetical protein